MTITRITNELDTRLDAYMRLSDRQLRSLVDPPAARIIVESHLALMLAVRLRLDFESILIDERHLESLKAELPEIFLATVPIYVASRELLSHIVGFEVTRGYFACVKRPLDASLDEVLQGATRVAVLEGIVDVSNVGALFRSAAALGVDAVLVSPNCADPYSRRAIRTSMGTVFQVPWAQVGGPWPDSLFDTLSRFGFTSCALALDERALPLSDPSLKEAKKLALFFGSEGQGLSKKVLGRVDKTVIIPMAHEVDSLNVAASSAVTFWELCRNNR